MAFSLLLLRHGKSDWRIDCDDFHRPLKKRGQQAARNIGLFLKQRKLMPDYVLCSPATRAVETCQICCRAMGLAAERVHFEESAYHADRSTIMALITATPAQHKKLMYVGHNPGIEEALLQLLQTPPPAHEDGKVFPTGTLACLQLAKPWQQLASNTASLNLLVRGKDLQRP